MAYQENLNVLRVELQALPYHELQIMAGQSWGMSPVWKYTKAELIDAMIAHQRGCTEPQATTPANDFHVCSDCVRECSWVQRDSNE